MNKPPDGTVMARVAAADPTLGVTYTATASDRLLYDILTTPQSAAPTTSASTRVVWLKWGAAVAIATVGLGVAQAVLAPNEAAFAGWSPTPRDVISSDLQVLSASCAATATGILNGEQSDIPVRPVLNDARGEYLYRISASSNAYATCFVSLDGDTPVAVGTSAVPGSELGAVGPQQITVAENGTASWIGDEGSGTLPGQLTAAYGQAGTDVASVVVQTTAGVDAAATVQNGWWVVWSPDANSLGNTAEVTLTNGEVFTTSIDPTDG